RSRSPPAATSTRNRPDGRGSRRGLRWPRLATRQPGAVATANTEGFPMLGEFRGFLLKTNALALAVGVIIGTALGTVVNSLVNDIIMPPVGLLLGGVDFSQLVIHLK